MTHLGSIFTLVRHLFEVYRVVVLIPVIIQMALCSEGFVAIIISALVGLLPGMQPHVGLQVALFKEGLLA